MDNDFSLVKSKLIKDRIGPYISIRNTFANILNDESFLLHSRFPPDGVIPMMAGCCLNRFMK